MILNRKDLTFSPYKDSRGKPGMSGKLQIAATSEGKRYLVKTTPMDVANEYVAHKLAQLIRVPTSDAVLIRNGNRSPKVGIAFEDDFKHVNMDDFWGSEKSADDSIPIFDGVNGKWIHSAPEAIEVKYPDDSPYLAECMAYLAFHSLIILQDNPQLAFAGGHLISFDYAESFCITESDFNSVMRYNGGSYYIKLFSERVFLKNGYKNSLKLLRRQDTDFLRNAYFSPLFAFQEADFQAIFDDLDAVFPSTVSSFYTGCFDAVKAEIERLGG